MTGLSLTVISSRLWNLTIISGSTLPILAGVVVIPALPNMASAFQNTPNADFLVKLTLTVPALFTVLSAPFTGFFLDRWGRRPVLITSLVLFGLAGASGFVLNSLFEILVGRAVLGLAIGGLMSGFTTLIVDSFTGAKLNQFMGYQGAAGGLGIIVFVLIGGVLSEFGWRVPFLVHLLAFVVLAGVLFSVHEPERSSNPGPTIRISQDWLRQLPSKGMMLAYVTGFVAATLFFVLPVQLPFYLAAGAGASSGEIGVAISLLAIASIIAALQYQRFKARLSFEAIFAVTFLALGISLVITALTPGYWIIVGGMMIGGVGLGLGPANNNAWVASLSPSNVRGSALGGLTTSTSLGQFLSPILAQPLVQSVGLAGTLGVVGGASLLVAVAFTGMALRRRGLSRSQSPSGVASTVSFD